MKLWIDTESVKSAGRTVQGKVTEMTADLDRQVLSRATRALNVLRNAELNVLKGQRSGRKYVSPFASRYDKHGNKRKRGTLTMYQASAPGEPPARRTGALRLHWNGTVEANKAGDKTFVKAVIESQEVYSSYLEEGTKRMKPRPYKQKIIDTAEPEVRKIYDKPYQ